MLILDDSDFLHIYLQLYYDELEPANPIGSRKTIHKLGCFYWSLGNLPDWHRSNRNFIHVAAIVTDLDIKKYGFVPILKKISADIEPLGLPFTLETQNSKRLRITGCYMNFVADNLAMKAVLGFNQNFSKGKCCYKCLVPVEQFKDHREELSRVQRLPDDTRMMAGTEAGKALGIAKKCSLRTAFFDPYDNSVVDLQHDIFEGHCGYIIKLVLYNLMYVQKRFNCMELNRRIIKFGYGRDSDGKPSEIDEKR